MEEKLNLILEYIVNKENANDLKNKYERDYYQAVLLESENKFNKNNIPVELFKPYDTDYIDGLMKINSTLNKIKEELKNEN